MHERDKVNVLGKRSVGLNLCRMESFCVNCTFLGISQPILFVIHEPATDT